MGGRRLRFGENMREEHLNLSKSGLVSEEGHSGWSPKILQLELWREIFSTKYGLSVPIKRI